MKTRLAISWILQGVVAVILAASAVSKFLGNPEAIRIFSALGMEPGGRFLIGGLEGLAALLLLLPFGVPWGAMLGWGLMSGAVIAHLTEIGISGMLMPMSLAAAFNWCACSAILAIRRDQVDFIRRMFE